MTATMARLLFFGPARQAAGVASAQLPGATVGELCEEAQERFGERLAELLPSCALWVNGEQADESTPVGPGDEVALVPPVSGGA
jgi:molybdopterin converting factor small subunit